MGWIALKMLVGDQAKFFGIVLGLTFSALADHPAGVDLLRADAADLRAGHRHHRRRPLGHGPGRPLYRRRQADAREQPVPGPRRRGRPLGRPALQGQGAGQGQPRGLPRQPGDGHRAGHPAGAR